jgi:cytochrome c2
MATQNRDQERLYAPGKLSFHFAIWSTLLLLVLVWMVWQDHARPWKDYQREYRKKEMEIAVRKQKNLVARHGGEQGLEALVQEEARARKALEQVSASQQVRDLEARLPELKQRLKDAEAYEKEIKGLQSPARYLYETALHHEKEGHGSVAETEKHREKYNRLSSEVHRAERAFEAAQADHDEVAAQVYALKREAATRLRKAEDKLVAYRSAQAAETGLAQKYVNNQWRNAAVIDFIAKTLEVKQVVLKDIHDNWNFATNVKVDRCMTCHLGIDQPDLTDEAIARIFASEIAQAYKVEDPYPLQPFPWEEPLPSSLPPSAEQLAALDGVIDRFKKDHGFESWMQAHPGLDLIAGPGSAHKVESIGCTVCHHGVGWSTDFSRSAHTAQTPEDLARWKAEHDWKPPQFVDFPMIAREYVQGMCFKCHQQGFGWPVTYVESLDHGWVPQRLEVPGKGLARLAPLDNFGKLALPPAPGAVDGPRREVARVRRLAAMDRLKMLETEDDANPVEAMLPDEEKAWREKNPHAPKRRINRDHYPELEVKPAGYSWDAEAYDKGEETIIRYGCQGCHTIKDFGPQVGYATKPRVGPSLSYLFDKVGAGWLERWIKHPDAYRPDTRMPSFFWFQPKDGAWRPIGADGKPAQDGALAPVPVLDSHLFDRDDHLRALGPLSTPDDVVRMNIQIACMTAYLLNQRDPGRSQPRSRANPDDPAFDALYAKDPLPGDWEKGRETVEAYGCVACHLVPEIKDDAGAWVTDDGARFAGELPQGPRITSLGSKLKDARWLNAWLARPRHFTHTTQMPDMRWKDVTSNDGTVLRSAEQVRADVVAYLLRYKDERFDALPGVGWDPAWNEKLKDMYEEYFGRQEGVLDSGDPNPFGGNLRRAAEVKGEFERRLGTGEAFVMVGEKLMARNGCFGCHEVKGHEDDQPIGTELTRQGIKDLHQLDFGLVHAVPHTRAGFFRTKIAHPRIWDHGKSRRWTDQLKMPRFNFRMDDAMEGTISTRAAVTGIVLGLVEEPIKQGALYAPDAATRDLIAYRRVVQRYGCDNCHPLEGKMSVMWRHLGAPIEVAPGEEPPRDPSSSWDLKFVVPPLFAQGERTQAGWLQDFLRNPRNLRPNVRQRMPKFELSMEEADALVAGFQRLAGIQVRNRYQPESSLTGRTYAKPLEMVVTDDQGRVASTRTVRSAVEEAEFLFDTINCNKCHLPKGTPGSDPTDGGVAPPFELTARRLGRDWVIALLNDPQHLIRGTGMISPWGRDGYGRVIDPKYRAFQLSLRDDPQWQALWAASGQGTKKGPERDEATRRLVEVQRAALADYVLNHYRWPREQPAEPR